MSAREIPRRRLLQAGALGAAAAAAATAAPVASARDDDSASKGGRTIWIASLTLENIQAANKEQALKQIIQRLELATTARPDLVCLPEIFNCRCNPRPPAAEAAETLDGPTITRLAAFARQKRCYIVAPITQKKDGKLFNTAVLLDRRGQVAGTYDKIHPTESELKAGITPGKEAKVFTTDFGKLGIQICFDIDWPDGWQMLRAGGAELVVWPAAYPGGFPLNAWAWTHRYPIVTSPWTNPATLIDLDGHNVATSGTWEPWLSIPFNLDRGIFHLDFHQQKVRDLEKAYGRDITVRWSHDENLFVLENRVPGRTLADLAQEFGLTSMDAYLARATAAQDQARTSG